MTSEDIRRRDFLLALGGAVGLAGAGGIILPMERGRRLWQVGAALARGNEERSIVGPTRVPPIEVRVTVTPVQPITREFMGELEREVTRRMIRGLALPKGHIEVSGERYAYTWAYTRARSGEIGTRIDVTM